MIKIKCNNVAYRYSKRFIFKNIDLKLEGCGIHIISGRNGSGKSTFLKIASGLIRPVKGSLEYYENDHSIEINNFISKIGYAAPYMNCIDDLTLQQNIDLIAKNKLNSQQLADNLKEFQLDGYDHYLAKSLSSGLYQRFKLLLSMINKPNVLFLDEPSSNLDLNGKEFLFHKLNEIKKDIMIILATNEEDEKKSGEVVIEFN